MYGYTRDHTLRLVRNPTPPTEMKHGRNAENNENNRDIVPELTMRDFLNPNRVTPLSCIVTPAGNANVFTVKAQHLQMLPHFHGLKNENPYLHIWDFEEVVGTICSNAEHLPSAWMKLFPFSMKYNAKSWINSLRPQSILAWENMQN